MNKDRRRIWWTLFLLAASGIAILIGYYMGMDKGTDKEEVLEKEIEAPIKIADPYLDNEELLHEIDGDTEQERESWAPLVMLPLPAMLTRYRHLWMSNQASLH